MIGTAAVVIFKINFNVSAAIMAAQYLLAVIKEPKFSGKSTVAKKKYIYYLLRGSKNIFK